MTSLVSLFLYQNQLSGCIPKEVSELKNMSVLLLYDNKFTCSIESLFSAAQSTLQTIDISSNRLTGGLPSSIFTLPQLETLSLAENCFSTTSLPDTVCNASSLRSLILDGLHS